MKSRLNEYNRCPLSSITTSQETPRYTGTKETAAKAKSKLIAEKAFTAVKMFVQGTSKIDET